MKNSIEKDSNSFDGFANKVWAYCEPVCLDLIKEVSRETKEFIMFKVKEFFENMKNK